MEIELKIDLEKLKEANQIPINYVLVLIESESSGGERGEPRKSISWSSSCQAFISPIKTTTSFRTRSKLPPKHSPLPRSTILRINKTSKAPFNNAWVSYNPIAPHFTPTQNARLPLPSSTYPITQKPTSVPSNPSTLTALCILYTAGLYTARTASLITNDCSRRTMGKGCGTRSVICLHICPPAHLSTYPSTYLIHPLTQTSVHTRRRALGHNKIHTH